MYEPYKFLSMSVKIMSTAVNDNVFNDKSQANYKYRTDNIKQSSIL